MSSRMEKLEGMLAADPQDDTLRYMLAMECDRLADTERALQLFRQLMEQQIPYVPAFVMAGQLLARLEQKDLARSTFEQGIEAALCQNNQHAAGEMQEFLRGL